MLPFRLLCLLVVSLFIVRPLRAQEGTLTVDASAELGPISPFIYGANYGPWALVSVDMMPAAEQAGVTHLRFPAGNWGDLNNITPFQLDMFMNQARLFGSEPSISVRLDQGTPEQAAELVRYANIEKGYGIRYWSIGNEPDLFTDYTVEELNREWRAIALAMEAVDPSIILIGPEVSQYPPTEAGDPYNNLRRDMVRGFLEVNGDLVDIVSIHRYPFPVSMTSSTTIEDLRDNPGEWDVIIPNLRALIRDTLGRDLPVAVTEVNSHWDIRSGGETSPDSEYHAIWWADVLGRMIRQQVEIVNYFNLSTSAGLGSFGLLGRYEVRPTYYVYQLYKQFGETLLSSTSSDAEVTLTAALRSDGALTLMIVNRGLAGKTINMEIAGITVSETADAWLLDAAHKADPVEPVDLSSGSVDLPAASVMLLVIQPA